MTKPQKTPRIVDAPVETPAAPPAEAAKEPAAPAEGAKEPAAPAARVRLSKRLLEAARERLRGTRVERLAKRLVDTAARAPALAERELDAALDRLGLVRKSKAPAATTAPAPKAA